VPLQHELQVFCMTGDHLTTRSEVVESYDVLVSLEPDAGGTIETVEEHDNLTQAQLDELLPVLEAKYGVEADVIDGV
jgi:hypothetical protein